jgi:hypothetical protein
MNDLVFVHSFWLLGDFRYQCEDKGRMTIQIVMIWPYFVARFSPVSGLTRMQLSLCSRSDCKIYPYIHTSKKRGCKETTGPEITLWRQLFVLHMHNTGTKKLVKCFVPQYPVWLVFYMCRNLNYCSPNTRTHIILWIYWFKYCTFLQWVG